MITLADDLNSPPELVTLYDYFSLMIDSPESFKEALSHFSKNEGYPLEYHYCEFSQELGPLDEGYFKDGVRFSIEIPSYHSEVIVSFKTFYKHLLKICDFYLRAHPEDLREVKQYLEIIKMNLNIK
ncbi:hypothetical protein AC739_14415 [Planococcus glaciei]|uniref:CDI immunity protein domain-containing protein n=1 Tax=Planococcus glaciei TaxID=459472 RepID=A0A7H8QD98_9BACL|nr:ribonuclease toxin immunity protein CdiI [Planococcus glaciei]ETP68058.1 hypothetical protein G159_14680 [Planococcus glaciei CHR43]KOF09612.1 hypothetical protein AC739_14415 [Planococcus glaciei]MBX0316293.1 hypothetical protein [Planococcus glaciei]QDY46373.1 hypothetical protein FK545_16505 [Planococcus glaciei]QKX51927.1 hypothetical protein HF394_15830 [Planococcus glaciei]